MLVKKFFADFGEAKLIEKYKFLQIEILCEYCVLGKQAKKRFDFCNSRHEILEYVHSNRWGPIRVVSLEGMHYFVIFVNDYLRKMWVYLIKSKNKFLGTFLK